MDWCGVRSLGHPALQKQLVRRAAEDELMATADERDALLPQLEEAKWRWRQADKDKAALQTTLTALQEV